VIVVDQAISILIVDDEEPMRRLLALQLEPEYQCETAESAEEALEMLSGGCFNIVLTDIMLPGASGLELCQAIQSKCPNTVVVMISGMTDIHYAIQAMRHGAFDYLLKPVDYSQLRKAIERALLHQIFVSELLSSDTYPSTLHALAVALKKREARSSSGE
jgi:two-component system response regulator YesN